MRAVKQKKNSRKKSPLTVAYAYCLIRFVAARGSLKIVKIEGPDPGPAAKELDAILRRARREGIEICTHEASITNRRRPTGMTRKPIIGKGDHRMFGIHEHPTVRFLAHIHAAIQGRHMDEYEIMKGIDVKKHVATADPAKPAMASWLGVEVLNLVGPLKDLERLLFHDCDNRHRPAAGIRTIRAQAVVNFIRELVVFESHWVVTASAFTRNREIAGSHVQLLQ